MSNRAVVVYDERSPSCLVYTHSRFKSKVGRPAGAVNACGYYDLSSAPAGCRSRLAHRIVWELHYGEIPEGLEIDHIDGNPGNNVISNLRLADDNLQMHNRKVRKDKLNDLPKGVFPNGKRYMGRVTVHGTRISKTFATVEDAAAWVRSVREYAAGASVRH